MHKRQRSIGTLALSVCLLVLAAGPLWTQTLSKGADYVNIAPNPIPVSETGATGIGVLKLDLSETAGTAAYLWKITLTENAGNEIENEDITDVRVFLNSVSPDKFRANIANNTGEIPVTLDKTTEGTLVLTLDGGDADARVPANATDRSLWIAFDLAAGLGVTGDAAVGFQISSVEYSNSASSSTPTGGSPLNPGALGTTRPLRDYEVTFVASGQGPVGPWTEQENAENVEVLLLQFGGAGDEAVTKEIATITVSNLGYDGYVIGNGVGIYLDDGDGVYESGIDASIGAGTLASGEATITTVSGANVQFSTTTRQYLVTVTLGEIDPFVAGRTIELQIANPKVDITFRDFVTDDGQNILGEYAQVGYITATAATPTTQNAFEVTEYIAPDITPPSVVASSPPNGGTVDELSSPVVIYFSEDVQGADVDLAYDFEDIDGVNVPFTVIYSNTGGEYTATLQPNAPLDYETFYEVTVIAAGITDYATPAPNVMAADKEITFGTGLEFPVVTEPTVVRNRIVTGRADESEMVILIPTPAGGPSAKVTVQVFTASGRLVRTFVKNVAYSTITDGRIRWDGTNDGGKDLGPGVYFVQVRTAEYKRALKVMIVR